uniref:Protein kinase domain-containing protein n=1 Tax=Hyaloperonospora arabidopsidis (strain Emoy2) TaxID=559515 RepID=M4BA17_HYAAE
MVIAAFGGCLVGLLLFFLATTFSRCQRKRHTKLVSASPGADDVQTPHMMEASASQAVYNSLHPTLHAGILNDPLIMSFRLNYTEVKVGRCISKGGFGLVYIGMYKQRRVAVKKIMREKCEKLSQIRMFIREIALMGSLKHERIVEFIGVAWDSLRNLSAVTEYMERGDLRDVLHSSKRHGSNADDGLTWRGLKLTIALHIAEGLAYMHSLSPKVIHRDLKSKNVLLNDAYEAKLSDFGVSRERQVVGAKGGLGKFMTPGVGTSFWIAPEVLLGKDYDEHADIFSFGVVLSELDTDDYPYWNSGTIPGHGIPDERRVQEQKILEKVALGSLRPTFYNDCPAGVLSLAASCLEGRPENRPSASEVVLTIKELIRVMLFDGPQSEPEPDEIVTAGFLSDEHE